MKQFPQLNLTHEELKLCRRALETYKSPFLCDCIMELQERGEIDSLQEQHLRDQIRLSINGQFSLGEYLGRKFKDRQERKALRYAWIDQELERTAMKFPKLDLTHEELLECHKAYEQYEGRFLGLAIYDWFDKGQITKGTRDHIIDTIENSLDGSTTLSAAIGRSSGDFEAMRQLRFDWLDQELKRTEPAKLGPWHVKESFKCGDKFKHSAGFTVTLCQVGRNTIQLICFPDANRWSETTVKSKPRNIAPEKVAELMGSHRTGEFTYVGPT